MQHVVICANKEGNQRFVPRPGAHRTRSSLQGHRWRGTGPQAACPKPQHPHRHSSEPQDHITEEKSS